MEKTFKAMNVKSLENISRRNEHNGTPKKSTLFLLVTVWRFQYFRHILPNPNPKIMASFPNNHY